MPPFGGGMRGHMKKQSLIFLFCMIMLTGCRQESDSREPAIRLHEETEQVSVNRIEETAGSQEASFEPETQISGVEQDTAELPGMPDESDAVEAPADSKSETADLTDGSSVEETLAESEEEMHAERITYQDGFYYEPLSEEVRQRITGRSYPADCPVPYDDLRYIRVLYCDFNNTPQIGEIICNQSIAQDIVEIFYELYQASYPIEKIRLIDEYNADDDLSCQDNNTSSFCYRTVAGSKKLSKHAQGLAIDINPFYNPYITYPNGVPTIKLQDTAVYADRSADFIAKIDHEDLAYKLFTEHGFTWGGDWNSVKDYQHFQK